MRSLLFFLIGITLSACSAGPYPVTSHYYRIPSGSKLILKQALTIPPNAARVYIQYGKVVTPNEKDNWHAHCWFLSWNVFEHAQVIKPDTFIITHSQQLEDIVMRHTKLQYALLGNRGGNSGVPTALIYTTEMRIHSDSQSAIRRFACSHWENPNYATHLTVKQMQQALGQIVKIELSTHN
jgi:hypothetical protein